MRRFGICLLLSIAWSASMGGVGTLLGSPPNAIVAGYVAAELGREIGFLEWMMVGVPLAFSFILLAWVLMTRLLYRFELAEIPGGRQMLQDELGKLGPMSQGEKMVLLVAAVVTLVLFLTEVTSNTATAATFIPVLGGYAFGIRW